MTKQLLAENRKALQFLHHAKGFDFEKPYNIVRKVGRFTSRTVAACVPEGHAAVALLKPIETRRRSWAPLYYVEIGADGNFYPLRKDGVKYYDFSGIDYMFSKGEFEGIRKNETDCIYIITQAPEHLRTSTEPRLDLSDRLRKTEFRRWGDGRGNAYIGSIYLASRIHNMKPVEYKTSGKPAALEDVIDKSGYMVGQRRADLKRRANLLRSEKARQRAAAADFSAEAAAIAEKLEEAKKALSAAVLSATVSGDFYAISSTARNLRSAADYLDRYNRWKASGKYQTVESIRYDLEQAREYIRKGAM